MAHLTIQYSYELDKKYDFIEFTEGLRMVMVNSKIFPIGGIRIRCLPTISNAIADGHQDNRYVDLILRMGVGRTKKEKTRTLSLLEAIMRKKVRLVGGVGRWSGSRGGSVLAWCFGVA